MGPFDPDLVAILGTLGVLGSLRRSGLFHDRRPTHPLPLTPRRSLVMVELAGRCTALHNDVCKVNGDCYERTVFLNP